MENKTQVFTLERDEDETGISGVGTVADGVIFPDGRVVLCWRGDISSIVIHNNIQNVDAIHGHGGKTRIVMQ